MERFIVIEARGSYMYTYEVSRDFKDGKVNYHRTLEQRPGLCSVPRPELWLDSLLKAPEAIPEVPSPDQVAQERTLVAIEGEIGRTRAELLRANGAEDGCD